MPESKGRQAHLHPAAQREPAHPAAEPAVVCPGHGHAHGARPALGRDLLHLGVHQYPVPQIGRWNLGAGFALMMAGFLMTTRWR